MFGDSVAARLREFPLGNAVEIDWGAPRGDVQRFLPRREQEGLQLWSEEFFLYQVDRMEGYLADGMD